MHKRRLIGLAAAAAFLLASAAPLAAQGAKSVPPPAIHMSCFAIPPYDGTLKFVNDGPGTAPANSFWQWSFGFPGPAKGTCRLAKPLAPQQTLLVSTGHITSIVTTCDVNRVYLLPIHGHLAVVPVCGNTPK